jgi:hypothetical protein
MTKRFLAVLALAGAAAACGHPEKGVVDQYFNAVNANDTQTLSSFAAVTFDQKVEKWAIKKTISEDKRAAALPDLSQKAKDADAAVAANKKAASAWSLDNYGDIDQVREARKKNQPVPAKLTATAQKWDEYNDKDRQLKKSLAEARDAVEKEKRNVARSVGEVENVETLQGEVTEKVIELDLTVKGETKPYVMTLRKYELKRDGGGPRVMSRWVIQDLKPSA